MKQTNFISSLIHHHYHLTTLFFFFFLLKTCQSIDDQQYLDCGVPQTCGHQIISYPFYIDQHKQHCGFPGFDLSCNSNNQPIINLSNNSYVVHDIFYENQSIRISNAEFLSKELDSTSCFPISIQNLTLSGNQFDFALNNTNLFVWSNCSSNFTSHDVVSCSDDKLEMILEYDLNFGNVSRNCRNGFKVPVELDDEIGEDWEYYERLLRRGFLLKWNASDCGVPQTCQSIDDQQYLDCGVPQTCGRQIISYPFYIDQHKSHCGFPGFDLSCNSNNQPIINLSNNSYVVHDIFYENQSIRISNAEFLSKELDSTSCFPISIQNLTLSENQFDFALNNTNLFVWSNCSSNFTSHDVVSCSDDKLEMILENDLNFGNVSRNCRNGFKVPVELDDEIGEDWEYYERLLRRGFLLEWTATNCSVCQQSGGRCGFHCATKPTSVAGDKIWALKLGLGILAAGFGILMMLAYCYCSMKFSSTILKNKENRTNQNVEIFLKNKGSFAPKRYSYSDVKRMTNSFKYELGKGGFGCVYKGKLNDDRLVAVKILNNSKGKNGEEFMNELASISRTSHVNIVTLLGFCFDGSHRALIYEFMPNGSLEKFIYDEIPRKSNRQLGWETLYRIAIGIARGLEYLHRGCNTRILHFDIKPHNILLDGDFCPKISDFGLAKLCPKKESIISMLSARGTVGYIAPELFCRTIGGVSHKSDVYSFGMMVLEMVGGRKNIDVGVGMDHTSQIYFPHWIYNRIESNNELGLHGGEITMDDEENEKARKMILVSLWCIQTDPSNRPPMSRVLEMLEGKLESLQIPPKPFLSSPSRAPLDSSTTHVETLSQL